MVYLRNRLNSSLLLFIAFTPVLLLCGCAGEELVVVKGQVLRGGKPVLSYRNAKVSIYFLPVTEPGSPPDFEYPASIASAGGFEVKGLKGNGIPPGKYRVAVEIQDKDGYDKSGGQLSRLNSPIIREVKNPPEEIVIDLAKPTG